MPDWYGMAERHWEKLRQTMARHPGIKRVVLYGSRAKGTHHSGSDFDIAVEAPAFSFGDWARLSWELEELPLVYPIDFVWVEGTADERLRERIRDHGKTIFTKDEIYADARKSAASG